VHMQAGHMRLYECVGVMRVLLKGIAATRGNYIAGELIPKEVETLTWWAQKSSDSI